MGNGFDRKSVASFLTYKFASKKAGTVSFLPFLMHFNKYRPYIKEWR